MIECRGMALVDTVELLREAFSETSILHLDKYDGVLSEGVGQTGMSAIVDLVACKRAFSLDKILLTK
jgi:hypothetical protein